MRDAPTPPKLRFNSLRSARAAREALAKGVPELLLTQREAEQDQEVAVLLRLADELVTKAYTKVTPNNRVRLLHKVKPEMMILETRIVRLRCYLEGIHHKRAAQERNKIELAVGERPNGTP